MMKPMINRRVIGMGLALFFGALRLGHADSTAQSLVESLRDDDEAIAQNAEAALVKLGPDAVRPLQKVLDDGNFKVRRRATETLGQLGPLAKRAAPDLVLRLADPQYDVQTAAQIALKRLGDDAIPALVQALQSDQPALRQVALASLAQAGPKAVPIILELLRKDESTFIRANAAVALGSADPMTTEIVLGLVHALSDLQESVRGSAADALGQSGAAAREAVRPLFTVSQNDQDSLVRQKAMDALYDIGSSTPTAGAAVAEVLGGLLAKPEPATRMQAVAGAERLGVSGLPVLIQALSDQDAPVSDEAGNAIVRIGAPALPSLVPLQQSTFPFLKRKADELIQRINRAPAGQKKTAPKPRRKKHS